MFIKEHGAAAILLAIVFMSLGFLLGNATSSHGHHRGCQSAPNCTHGADEGVQHITPPIQSGEPGSFEHFNKKVNGKGTDNKDGTFTAYSTTVKWDGKEYKLIKEDEIIF